VVIPPRDEPLPTDIVADAASRWRFGDEANRTGAAATSPGPGERL